MITTRQLLELDALLKDEAFYFADLEAEKEHPDVIGELNGQQIVIDGYTRGQINDMVWLGLPTRFENTIKLFEELKCPLRMSIWGYLAYIVIGSIVLGYIYGCYLLLGWVFKS